jgi:hypothetical protein
VTPINHAQAALAQAVARPGGEIKLIDADNRPAGNLHSLAQAVESGQAFMVQVRDGMIVLDLDDPSALWVPAARVRLETIGCQLVTVESGRAGHQHLFALSPVGWSSKDIRDDLVEHGAPAGQLRWGERMVRPPLSPHRFGGAGNLIEPADAAKAIKLLSRRQGQVDLKQKFKDLVRHSLPPDRRFVTDNGELNRNKSIRSAAIAYVNADRGFPIFEADVLANPALASKLQDVATPSNWLSVEWDSARAWVRQNPPTGRDPEAEKELNRIAELASVEQWRGRGGESDRRVLGALLELANSLGSTCVSHSTRTLASKTGLNRNTVSASLGRLIKGGWLSIEAPPGFAQATTYRLTAIENDCQTGQLSLLVGGQSPIVPSSCRFDGLTPPDAFRNFAGRRGLPQAAYRAWLATDPTEWQTTKQITTLINGNPRTVLSHLRRLLKVGLVERRGNTWRRGSADPDGVATQLKTAGATDWQQRKHRAERDAFEESTWAHTRMTREQYDRMLATKAPSGAPAQPPSSAPDA